MVPIPSSPSPQILAGIKAEAGRVTQRAGAKAFVARTVRLRGVFNYLEIVLSWNRGKVNVRSIIRCAEDKNSLSRR